MRILLVGEYSNLHNTLQTGLEALGHEVLLISSGDGFKSYPSDIEMNGKFFENIKPLNLIRQVLYRMTKTDLALIETGIRAWKNIKKLGEFDVVQLINEYPLKSPYFIERKIISQLRKKTKKLIVLGCGDDFLYLKNRHKLANHPIDFYQGKRRFVFSERYQTNKHKDFHDFVFAQKDIFITTDLDYHLIYEGRKDYYGLIPYPIHLDKVAPVRLPERDKIVIFHGINRVNYYKKGNNFFKKALHRIQQEFPGEVEILSVESLPYSEYIKTYDRAHILLDQCFAEDQGYNALEAMAKGKVVFTGAGKAFCKHYKLPENTVAIHTLPDADQIYGNLKKLIQAPALLAEISENAISFVRKHHDHIVIARRYEELYQA